MYSWGKVGHEENSFIPLRSASSSKMFTVSYGALHAPSERAPGATKRAAHPQLFSIWTQVLLKPHCGAVLLPFMNNTTCDSSCEQGEKKTERKMCLVLLHELLNRGFQLLTKDAKPRHASIAEKRTRESRGTVHARASGLGQQWMPAQAQQKHVVGVATARGSHRRGQQKRKKPSVVVRQTPSTPFLALVAHEKGFSKSKQKTRR